MKTNWHHSKNNNSRQLIILLPGIWDKPSDFEAHGFIETARQNNVEHDFLSVDANIGYLRRGNFSERFRGDVITPALEKGYESFWLVGISLGGYNALSYYLENSEIIDGVVLLSPYTGVNKKQDIYHRIRKFIDNDNSDSVSERIPYTNWERMAAFEKQDSLNNIYLAYGLQDEFAAGYDKFKEFLPPENILAINGNHDWQTWFRLWTNLLKRGMLEPMKSSVSQAP